MKKYTQNFNEFLSESEVSEKATWKAKGPFIAVGYGRHSGGEDEVIDFKDEFKSEKDAQKWIDKYKDRIHGLSWSVKTGEEYNVYDLGLDTFQESKVNEELTFVYNGVQINNPFMDDDGIGKQVDPTSYYGKDYTKAQISKVVNAMENLVIYYEDWKLSENGEFAGDVGDKLEEAYKQYKKAK